MTSMLIAPVDLSPALSGGPSLIVASGLPEADALAQAGLELWTVSGGAGGMGPLLHRSGADPAEVAEGAVPLGFAPMGVMAILAAEEEQAAPLLRWWQAITDAPPPPLVVAPDGRTALVELAGILGRALQAAESRCAGLLGQLAATRADYEETRVAMAAVTRVLGQRPTAGLKSLLSTRPSQTGLKVGTTAGRSLLLTQTMGVPVAGLAALALHLAEAVILDPGVAVLRLRLLGAESGRVLGAWDVPGAALSAPGWLVLDLPSPIGPVAETARLTLAAELGPDDQLALSLDDLATSPAMAVAGPEVPPGGDRALALKLWTSEFGNRFVAARYWNWDEAGLELPMEATPFVLPAEAWQEVRVVAGSCRLIALGEEAPRPVAMLGGGAEALVLLPLPPGIPSADVLRLDLTLQLGEPGQVQAAAWILPAGAEVGGTEDLGAALRWSGWRGFAPEETALSITMSLPPQAPRTEGLQLAVLLRSSADAPAWGVCSIEIGGLSVMALTAAVPAATAPVPEPLAPVEAAPAPSIAAARVNEHFRGDGGYEHLDISLIGLEAPAHGIQVPQMRFKIYHSGGPLMIEFRRAAGWPDAFDHWREIRSDEWGSIFEFSAASAPKALEGIGGTRDGALMSALLALLPAIAVRAARDRRAERSEVDAWADRARVFAEKVQLAMLRQGATEQASADQEPARS